MMPRGRRRVALAVVHASAAGISAHALLSSTSRQQVLTSTSSKSGNKKNHLDLPDAKSKEAHKNKSTGAVRHIKTRGTSTTASKQATTKQTFSRASASSSSSERTEVLVDAPHPAKETNVASLETDGESEHVREHSRDEGDHYGENDSDEDAENAEEEAAYAASQSARTSAAKDSVKSWVNLVEQGQGGQHAKAASIPQTGTPPPDVCKAMPYETDTVDGYVILNQHLHSWASAYRDPKNGDDQGAHPDCPLHHTRGKDLSAGATRTDGGVCVRTHHVNSKGHQVGSWYHYWRAKWKEGGKYSRYVHRIEYWGLDNNLNQGILEINRPYSFFAHPGQTIHLDTTADMRNDADLTTTGKVHTLDRSLTLIMVRVHVQGRYQYVV
ncbi:unnamed protein product [Amoebophrya sp. A25]|nr:unnamed protein product [Amoebophrya sp. A25]|eukprot:GSA25T00008045001.1